jgi:hypothetical protein
MQSNCEPHDNTARIYTYLWFQDEIRLFDIPFDNEPLKDREENKKFSGCV